MAAAGLAMVAAARAMAAAARAMAAAARATYIHCTRGRLGAAGRTHGARLGAPGAPPGAPSGAPQHGAPPSPRARQPTALLRRRRSPACRGRPAT
eukprot:scaffold81324_cov40-Phaeocystis_antarctica.AAC.1